MLVLPPLPQANETAPLALSPRPPADAYRLCKNTPGGVSERCFQQTPLKFAEAATQWLQHINGSKYEIPMTVRPAQGG